MIGTFTVGMAEYVVTGLLTQIANDMHVSISNAGLLIECICNKCSDYWPFMRIATINYSAKSYYQF